jgi:ribonuclease P protein component
VLPAEHRLRASDAFRRTVRSGRRAGSRTLVLHLATHAEPTAAPARVGFVVGRPVGGAVVRNRVRRRLRHLTRDLLPRLPESSELVVRALPAAARSSSSELGSDLVQLLDRVLRTA